MKHFWIATAVAGLSIGLLGVGGLATHTIQTTLAANIAAVSTAGQATSTSGKPAKIPEPSESPEPADTPEPSDTPEAEAGSTAAGTHPCNHGFYVSQAAQAHKGGAYVRSVAHGDLGKNGDCTAPLPAPKPAG